MKRRIVWYSILFVASIILLLIWRPWKHQDYFPPEREYELLLQHVHFMQKKYVKENGFYANEISQITLYEAPTFKLEIIEASDSTFLARATAKIDFDEDGIYSIWEIDQTGQLVARQKD